MTLNDKDVTVHNITRLFNYGMFRLNNTEQLCEYHYRPKSAQYTYTCNDKKHKKMFRKFGFSVLTVLDECALSVNKEVA